MTDLTKNKVIWALLDEETKTAMKECGGPWQVWGGMTTGWIDTPQPLWSSLNIYRKKPKPAKLVRWINAYKKHDGSYWTDVYLTETKADAKAVELEGYATRIGPARRIEINLEDET